MMVPRWNSLSSLEQPNLSQMFVEESACLGAFVHVQPWTWLEHLSSTIYNWEGEYFWQYTVALFSPYVTKSLSGAHIPEAYHNSAFLCKFFYLHCCLGNCLSMYFLRQFLDTTRINHCFIIGLLLAQLLITACIVSEIATKPLCKFTADFLL